LLDDTRVTIAAVKTHLQMLSHTPADLVVLRSLGQGCTTLLKSPVGDDVSVLVERRVLRQSCVVFEVRVGSKMRSWSKKQMRGTHKRQLWLMNEEMIVTKAIGHPVAYHELCREFVRQMVVEDASEGPHCMLAIRFASGFVFTAHFSSRRELDVWMSLLRADDTAHFPWGLPFEEPGAIDENRESGKEILFCPIKSETSDSVHTRIANIEGLVSAQLAAVALEDNFSIRATRKRQNRIQRAMFGVLREMHNVTLSETQKLMGIKNEGAPLNSFKMRPKKRNISSSSANSEDDSWSESDDGSSDAGDDDM
jgi:hypothetical protein